MSDTPNEVKREDGWHWLYDTKLINGPKWRIGFWCADLWGQASNDQRMFDSALAHRGSWMLAGTEERFVDSDFSRIGPRCVNPITATQDELNTFVTDMVIAQAFKSLKPEIEKLCAGIAEEITRDAK